MRDAVEVPARLWEALRAAHPDASDAELAALALARGRSLEGDPLRVELAERAALVFLLRRRLARERTRLAEAERRDRAGYERHLALQRDVVPPLKERARALRARIRALEARARAAGVDPEAVAPRIDWADTLAVDDYVPPRFERDEDRRRAAIGFFRRLG